MQACCAVSVVCGRLRKQTRRAGTVNGTVRLCVAHPRQCGPPQHDSCEHPPTPSRAHPSTDRPGLAYLPPAGVVAHSDGLRELHLGVCTSGVHASHTGFSVQTVHARAKYTQPCPLTHNSKCNLHAADAACTPEQEDDSITPMTEPRACAQWL